MFSSYPSSSFAMVQKKHIFFPSPKMKDYQTMCASLPSLLPQAGTPS